MVRACHDLVAAAGADMGARALSAGAKAAIKADNLIGIGNLKIGTGDASVQVRLE